MTDPVKEQLSACLDGELPEGELDLLLKQVSREPQLRSSLGRYALIGETLRAQAPVVAPANFSDRVSAAIATEPPLLHASVSKRNETQVARWLRPAAGLAVAASVAAIAILVLQPRPQDEPHVTAASSAEQLAQTDIPDSASYIVPANTATTGIVPAARLTNYVVAHSEYSTPLGRRSVLSGVLAEEEAEEATERAADFELTEVAPQP